MVAVPARHHLLKHRRIPLDEVLHFPLVLCDPQACEGYARQVERVLRRSDREPLIVERVASFDLMMVVVSAGFALGWLVLRISCPTGNLALWPGPWRAARLC